MKLREVASVIRSKNSGPFELTFDVMLPDDETYRKISEAKIITAETVAKAYGIPESMVLSVVEFPTAHAIKATIVRPMPSGAMGERDVYGAQQHAPLMELELPEL